MAVAAAAIAAARQAQYDSSCGTCRPSPVAECSEKTPVLLISPHQHKSEHSRVPLLNAVPVLRCNQESLHAAIR